MASPILGIPPRALHIIQGVATLGLAIWGVLLLRSGSGDLAMPILVLSGLGLIMWIARALAGSRPPDAAETIVVQQDSETVLARAREVLSRLNPEGEPEIDPTGRSIAIMSASSSYSIGEYVSLYLESSRQGTTVHINSGPRLGNGIDFGKNRKNVELVKEELLKLLTAVSSGAKGGP